MFQHLVLISTTPGLSLHVSLNVNVSVLHRKTIQFVANGMYDNSYSTDTITIIQSRRLCPESMEI